MFKRIFIIILGALCLEPCVSQDNESSKILRIGYQLVVDNDAFTLDLSKDQYYSSGIYPTVRILIDSLPKSKRIRSYQFNHRMYTPSWIGWETQNELDRPYAGIISGSVSDEFYFKTEYLNITLEAGWLGPGSKVGETQTTWHRWFGMPEPKGWKFQINNTPLLTLALNYKKPLYQTEGFEIVSESSASGGTVFNFLRQDLLIRFGKFKPLNRSTYTGGKLGDHRMSQTIQKTQETYFFYSPGLEYVFYNATLEGNLIGSPSIFVVNAEKWVWQHRAGIMFSWPRFDLGFTAFWRTKENSEATKHNYVSIRLNQRF